MSDREGTARKSACSRLAILLVPILDERGHGARSDLARRLGVTPHAVTQALNPAKYDTNLPLLERIADELGYETTITYTVSASVRLKRAKPNPDAPTTAVADAMEAMFG